MELTDLVYIDSTGYHYSDYPSWETWLIEKYQAIYGADVYLGADSQDGQFLRVLVKGFYDTATLGASVYSSFSPSTAQGVGLSRNVKINGLERRIPSYSTVDVDIVGVVGTTIVNGVAEDTLNQKWNLPASVTIPSGGTDTVTATAQEIGAISAEINTVNKIFTPTQGWQTVNNATAASMGAPVETDAELRLRQTVSVANPSLTVLEGQVGAVFNLPGVTDVKGYENDTGSTDGNGIPAHSVCLVVEGGDSEEIAETIALHKTPGTGTYGNTTELVYDAEGMPLNISFERPTIVTIACTVTIVTSPGYSAGFEDLIKQSIADVINGFKIGSTVYITKLYYPAYLNGSPSGETYDVVTITIGADGDPESDINIPLDFNELPVCDPSTDVVVVVT